LAHFLQVISRRKSAIQNKTKVVNFRDNLDNVKPYRSVRGRTSILQRLITIT
jgi:hypothetical protein